MIFGNNTLHGEEKPGLKSPITTTSEPSNTSHASHAANEDGSGVISWTLSHGNTRSSKEEPVDGQIDRRGLP